ncbi:hypothetical protein CEXT_650711 [Caerostris extrusa]|uniref:Uncharacterized protein n=1 Tax=Caerostris extrusa TaxID=172846 RepID=A0AAV4MNE2_CAEEX|nr:hypothetical protein CEXT_650711 [Caerostris extrusa]
MDIIRTRKNQNLNRSLSVYLAVPVIKIFLQNSQGEFKSRRVSTRRFRFSMRRLESSYWPSSTSLWRWVGAFESLVSSLESSCSWSRLPESHGDSHSASLAEFLSIRTAAYGLASLG